jgi:hypothetical protein
MVTLPNTVFLPIWAKRDFAGAAPARDIIEGQHLV